VDPIPLTEDEWPDSDELWRMLHHVFGVDLFSPRKQFLFCVGVCRLRGSALPVEYLPILDGLEVFADSSDLVELGPVAFWVWEADQNVEFGTTPFEDRLSPLRRRAAEVSAHRSNAVSLLHPDEWMPSWDEDPRFEGDVAVFYALRGAPFACCRGDGTGSISRSRAEADFLRELFGNPFRGWTVDPAWLSSTVLSIARAIYQARAFDRLPILADALEDAGCDRMDLLAHCRSEGLHTMGCWAVDLLLGMG
jgi:hypothetical protein